MRLSKEQAACNRQKIVEAAARLFRERGIDAVGVADLMKAAGFTHGGFYNHFPSKEALAAEACSSAFDGAVTRLEETVATAADGSTLSRCLQDYLSPAHRDDPNGGCPTASLAALAGRQGEGVQAACADGLEGYLAIFASQLSKAACNEQDSDPAVIRERALRLLSEIVGALVLARAVARANPALSDEILEASRRNLPL